VAWSTMAAFVQVDGNTTHEIGVCANSAARVPLARRRWAHTTARLLVGLKATLEEVSEVLPHAAARFGLESLAGPLHLVRTLWHGTAPASLPPYSGAEPLKIELLRGLPVLSTMPHPPAPLQKADASEEILTLEESFTAAMHAAIEDDVAAGGDGRGWSEACATQASEEVEMAQRLALVDGMALSALECGVAAAVAEVCKLDACVRCQPSTLRKPVICFFSAVAMLMFVPAGTMMVGKPPGNCRVHWLCYIVANQLA
jgi:hypothetical protein